MSIEVYPHEEKIADLVKNNTASIAFQLSTDGNTAYASEHASVVDLLRPSIIDKDSMWFPAILVTTNWNRNDDVFSPEEVAKAKKTPINKPINWQHNGDEKKGNEIIGVINACIPVDDSYDSIPDEVNLSGLDKYHLSVGCLVWKQNFPSYVKRIEEGLEKNTLFISMESTFPTFGYALTTNGKDISLIDRNPNTAWLSQFLRAYKGPGIVNIEGVEYRVGRWLKNITFMGAGMVNNPGNPESIILLDKPVFASAAKFNFQENENELVKSVINGVSSVDNNLESNIIMADTKEIKAVANDAEAAMEKVKSEFMDKVKAAEDAKASVEAAKAKVEAELAAAKLAIAESESKAAKLEAALNQANEAKAKVEADLSTASKSLADAQSTIASAEKDKVASARFEEAKSLGLVSDPDSDLKKFRDMDESTFASIKEYASKAVANAKIAPKEAVKTEVDVKSATDEVAKAEVDKAEVNVEVLGTSQTKKIDNFAILQDFLNKEVVKTRK